MGWKCLCLFLSLSLFIMTSCATFSINTHTRDLRRNYLECGYFGEGVYSPDRTLGNIMELRFPYFRSGTISVDSRLMPDLMIVKINGPEASCKDVLWSGGGSVEVNGRLCLAQVKAYCKLFHYSTLVI